MELVDEVVIVYASPGGNLERLCGAYQGKTATKSVTIGLNSYIKS